MENELDDRNPDVTGARQVTNEIDNKKSTEMTPGQADFFEGYGNAATARSIVGTLLRFNKGDYYAGTQDEEIPLGTRFAAIMNSLMVGWVCWQGNVPIEQQMGPVCEGHQPKRRNELGDLDEDKWERDDEGEPRDPWAFTNYLVMRRIEDSELFTFTTTSKGGLGAIGELCKAHGKHIRQRPDQDPVIELDAGSYLHRDRARGRIKIPVFTIVDWIAKDDDTGSTREPPKSLPPSQTAAAKPAAKF